MNQCTILSKWSEHLGFHPFGATPNGMVLFSRQLGLTSTSTPSTHLRSVASPLFCWTRRTDNLRPSFFHRRTAKDDFYACWSLRSFTSSPAHTPPSLLALILSLRTRRTSLSFLRVRYHVQALAIQLPPMAPAQMPKETLYPLWAYFCLNNCGPTTPPT